MTECENCLVEFDPEDCHASDRVKFAKRALWLGPAGFLTRQPGQRGFPVEGDWCSITCFAMWISRQLEASHAE